MKPTRTEPLRRRLDRNVLLQHLVMAELPRYTR